MPRYIAVSNIAWSGHPMEPFLDILAEEGARGLEFAASLIWPEPIAATPAQRSAFRAIVEQRGLQVSGLHALLFARKDLQLLAGGAERAQVLEYLQHTIDLCAELGGQSLVLGGPKNRRRDGLSREEADRRGASILHDLGDYAAVRGCFIALEALPAPACDFIVNLTECREMVRMSDSSGVRLHVDTGAGGVTEERTSDHDLEATLQGIGYCQANDYDLLPPGSKTPDIHRRWSKILNALNYSGRIGIEMRATQDPAVSVRQAIQFVKTTYPLSTERISDQTPCPS